MAILGHFCRTRKLAEAIFTATVNVNGRNLFADGVDLDKTCFV
jgi:hypothetical protein